MDRGKQILKFIEVSQRGIEIGPWFRPLVAKAAGFNSLVLDVFDRNQLVLTASQDSNVAKNLINHIEEVDLLGTSTDIERLVDARNELGMFDYIVSSHNFEHVPNPIRFLQGCGRVLKRGGMLSMAIPDHRACFDVFKSVTSLGQWIEAFVQNRDHPSPLQLFEHICLTAEFNPNDPANSRFIQGPELAFRQWRECAENPRPEYEDAHCWSLTPASFRFLVFEVGALGLSPFEVVEISRTNGNEFYVHLRNVGVEGLTLPGQSKNYREKRQTLLFEMMQEPRYMAPVKIRGLRSFARYVRNMVS